MPDRPRRQDWRLLGVEPGADRGQVRRSYLERRALYASDSTATYNLLEEDERQRLLAEIEEAYRRITGSAVPVARPSASAEELPAAPPGPPPPPDDQPGAHLRYHRLSSSMLLAEVAATIKVRAALLEKIEEEQFADLPAPVYVRGFVVQYATLLGLADPEGLASAYLARMRSTTTEGP